MNPINKIFATKIAKYIFSGAALVVLETGAAQAITITPTDSVGPLLSALTAGGSGINVTGVTLNGQSLPSGEVSTGTFTNAKTYNGIGSTAGGIVISTGDVADYADGPNSIEFNSTDYGSSANAAQQALLTPLSGGISNHFDVTQLDITFDMDAGKNRIFFDVVFGSDEYSEFVGSNFIDALGLFVNGTNIAFANGQPININNPGFQAIAGTELDGIITNGGNPVLHFSQSVDSGSTGNTLTFIIGDASDSVYDSTAYIANLGAESVPEPSSVLGLLAMAGMGSILKRKKSNSNQ
ncbi:MAG: PEP-CTERM sorting domain-containing protein [Moorea sp. SIO2B7]|nr:PEP-CTERM sorting domain-containing protein [Moorena sp. SIO2B7]